jgi:hypothetical protein
MNVISFLCNFFSIPSPHSLTVPGFLIFPIENKRLEILKNDVDELAVDFYNQKLVRYCQQQNSIRSLGQENFRRVGDLE